MPAVFRLERLEVEHELLSDASRHPHLRPQQQISLRDGVGGSVM